MHIYGTLVRVLTHLSTYKMVLNIVYPYFTVFLCPITNTTSQHRFVGKTIKASLVKLSPQYVRNQKIGSFLHKTHFQGGRAEKIMQDISILPVDLL